MKPLTIRLDYVTYNLICEASKKHKISKAAYVRLLIKNASQQHANILSVYD